MKTFSVKLNVLRSFYSTRAAIKTRLKSQPLFNVVSCFIFSGITQIPAHQPLILRSETGVLFRISYNQLGEIAQSRTQDDQEIW